MRLTRIVAPSAKPVDLTTVKAHLYIDSADDDALLEGYLNAVVALIDGPSGIGYCCCSQTWRLSLDAFPASIKLPVEPVADDAEVTVSYIDRTGTDAVLDAGDYRLSGGVIEPAFGKRFPSTLAVRGAVTIEFVAGTSAGNVPADIKQAILQVIADWYRNREMAAAGRIEGVAADIFDSYRTGWMAA
jgi:uncharacterized phiE125 gp8 family phage protein